MISVSYTHLAGKLGIPQLIVGLTIVAMGTSLPEAAVSITSALKGSAGITIGNVVGSNIMNVLVILGITAVITNVAIQKSTLYCEIPFMIGITALMIVFGITRRAVSFPEGVIFWILFIAFLAYLFVMSKKNKAAEEEDECQMSYLKCIIFIIAGGIMVVWGSDLVVDAASEIARAFGMSERFIGCLLYTSIYLVAVIILGALLAIIIWRAMGYFTAMFKKYDDLNESVQENVSAIRVVKAYVREKYEKSRFTKASGNVYRMAVKAERIVSFNSPLMMLTVYSCILDVYKRQVLEQC